jgi:hypothetical protein
MTSKRFVSAAVLVGVLSAVPVFAQNARARGEQSGDRGDRGNRGGDRGDRGGERRGGSEGRVYQRSERAPQQRAYDGGRQVERRQYTAPRRVESQRRYDSSRQYDNRRSTAPRSYTAPRAYNYDRRTYTRPYSNSNRGYAAPRRDPYYRNNVYRGYGNRGYGSRSYSYSRRYVYGGYRGVYGYGGGYRRTRIVTVLPWRPYHYRPRFGIGVYYGAGGVYDYGYTPSYFYDPLPGRTYGGVRITEAPRDAQVFADGYYVGIVDDFDGVFQHVNLEPGQHRIEVRARDTEPISFDVYVQPGRTITLRADDYDDGYYDNSNGDGY